MLEGGARGEETERMERKGEKCDMAVTGGRHWFYKGSLRGHGHESLSASISVAFSMANFGPLAHRLLVQQIKSHGD